MIKTYSQAVKFLESFIPDPRKKYPGKLGLLRMQYIADLLGNPELKYKTIHVGGTSGKGSTSGLIYSILSTKYNIGLYTSPHLIKLNERIRTGGRDISDVEVIELINKLEGVIDRVSKSEYGRPSHFEIITAMAFVYFLEKKIDVAVVEVGLGGSVDATNIIKPEVAILTNVGLDHTQVLGRTVEEIAKDKAGIMKKNVEIVSGVKQKSVIRIIESRINQFGKLGVGNQKSRLSLLRRDFNYKVKRIGEKGSTFDYFGKNIYKDLRLSMIGEYQIENASLAIKAVEELNREKAEIKEEDIRKGLEKAFIPGRMEIVRRNPLVLLDGAHNPDKMMALVNSIKKIFPKKKIYSILAIKSDKDAKKMVVYIVEISHKFILTKFKLKTDIGNTYSYEPKQLQKMIMRIDRKASVVIVKDSRAAVGEALEEAGKDDLILVTGSLYLVGEIREFIISN